MLRDLQGSGLWSPDPSLVAARPFLLTAPSRSIHSPGFTSFTSRNKLVFRCFPLSPARCRDYNTSRGPPALSKASRLSCRTSSSQYQWPEHSREQGPGCLAQLGDQEGQQGSQAAHKCGQAPPSPCPKGVPAETPVPGTRTEPPTDTT